jgi:hypothetical protein
MLLAADLPQIIRFVPCRPDSEIIFPNVAAMKAWKRLTAILRHVWTTRIIRQCRAREGRLKTSRMFIEDHKKVALIPY